MRVRRARRGPARTRVGGTPSKRRDLRAFGLGSVHDGRPQRRHLWLSVGDRGSAHDRRRVESRDGTPSRSAAAVGARDVQEDHPADRARRHREHRHSTPPTQTPPSAAPID